MEFLHASIALLASMVLVLAGMVGWLYWQQTRLFQNMNSIVMIIGELARPPAPLPEPEAVTLPEPEPEAEVEVKKEEEIEEEEEDDRVSVEDTTEVVDGPPAPLDTDSLEGKTTKELKDLLTKRGIPFGKRDSKNILISLLKATA
jgi:hypothetical protein